MDKINYLCIDCVIAVTVREEAAGGRQEISFVSLIPIRPQRCSRALISKALCVFSMSSRDMECHIVQACILASIIW